MKFFIVALGLVGAAAIEQSSAAQARRSVWNGMNRILFAASKP